MTYFLNKSEWYNSRIIPEGMNLDMLNMPGRLEILLKPSIDLIDKNKVFIDLGCGTGVLGMYALERGAKFVYFVEQNEQMIHILYNVLPKILDKSKYKIIQKDISNLTKDDFDVVDPEIVVSEFYGPRLFDEGYVNYTRHLLGLFPNCYFIPEKFSGNFCLAEIDYTKSIWPENKNLLDYFKFMYSEKGFAKSLEDINIIKNVGSITFNANTQTFENSLQFKNDFNGECLLVGIMDVEHATIRQHYTHIGWFLNENDYNKTIKISFEEDYYFNPKKETIDK